MADIADKVYDEEGFEVGEDGERVIGEDGNPILKPEDEGKAPKETDQQEGESNEDYKIRITELERENAGLKYSIGEERRRRREAEEAANKPKISLEDQELMDAEPLTRGELKKIKEDLKNELRQETMQAQDKISLQAAATKYENFAEIEKMAYEVINSDPDFAAAFNSTQNLGECLAKIAKNHPDYEARLKQQVRQEVVSKIKKGNEKVNTVAGGAGTKGGTEDYSDLSLADYDKLTPKQRQAVPESIKERILGGTE